MIKNAATASKVSEPRRLTPAEIREYEERRPQLDIRLENAREALAKNEADLADVVNAANKAERFLTLSENVQGYEGQRVRARETIAYCARRKAELEPVIENRRRMVREIQEQLSVIPRAVRDRDNELSELARQLSLPLP